MATKRIPLTEADAKQLRHHASVVMGIDGISQHHTAAVIIGKINAVDPNLTEIDVEIVQETVTIPTAQQPPAAASAPEPTEQELAMTDRQLAHHKYDPKVRVYIGEPYDQSRFKDVVLSVNGASITLRRGMEHEIPYRFYLSLAGAKETFMVDTDELHPATGLPIKEPRERPTIAHSLAGPLPSPEQIAEFMQRTAHVSM